MSPPASSRRPVLSAVIACYGDAPAVPIMYERLRAVFDKIDVDYEIIFVNDGSPDNAREVLGELAARDPQVVVVHHSRNFGSQAAFTSGMRISTGDAVVLLDGDLQDPPELIEDFYRAGGRATILSTGSGSAAKPAAWMALAYKAFYRLFPGSGLRPRARGRGRFLPLGPPSGRCAQPDAGEQPFYAGPAGMGRIPPDRHLLRSARADVRPHHQQLAEEIWAGHAGRSSPFPTCPWT